MRLRRCLFASKQRLLFESPALFEGVNIIRMGVNIVRMHNLRVYADFLNGEIYHYRDKNGLECDAVIHLKNGSYGLIEIKLGGASLISEGVHTLNKLSEKIDTDKMNAPSFRMVLSGTGSFAYKDPSGVLIVPIGALRP